MKCFFNLIINKYCHIYRKINWHQNFILFQIKNLKLIDLKKGPVACLFHEIKRIIGSKKKSNYLNFLNYQRTLIDLATLPDEFKKFMINKSNHRNYFHI